MSGTIRERASELCIAARKQIRDAAKQKHAMIDAEMKARLKNETQERYEELIALCDRAKAAGRTPWEQVGFELSETLSKIEKDML